MDIDFVDNPKELLLEGLVNIEDKVVEFGVHV